MSLNLKESIYTIHITRQRKKKKRNEKRNAELGNFFLKIEWPIFPGTGPWGLLAVSPGGLMSWTSECR